MAFVHNEQGSMLARVHKMRAQSATGSTRSEGRHLQRQKPNPEAVIWRWRSMFAPARNLEVTPIRLPLPLPLALGETRSGSLFYPMVRSPGSLALYWSNETGSATAVLPLEFLQTLHVPAAPVNHASKQSSP